MKIYRFFLDLIEEWTTGCAQTIVVNSEYTQQVFFDNFPWISAKSKKEEKVGYVCGYHFPEILYPPINEKGFNKSQNFVDDISKLLGRAIDKKTKILTSLNRYERKKNIPLALQAFNDYLERVEKTFGTKKAD